MFILRALAWALLVTIAFVSLSPATMRPESGLSISLEHIGLFAFMTFVFVLGHAWRMAYCLTFLIVLNGLIEWAQMLVPGRHARLSDFATKSIGIFVGLALGYLARRRIANWIK